MNLKFWEPKEKQDHEQALAETARLKEKVSEQSKKLEFLLEELIKNNRAETNE